MPWLIGIDEAGYGPNLGPFVASAVAVPVPVGVTDLWDQLAVGVRRAGGRADGRLVVDDSKKVYAPSQGLAELERQVRATLGDVSATLAEFVTQRCPGSLTDLAGEAWYTGQTPLPLVGGDVLAQASRFAELCASQGVGPPRTLALAVPTPRFNDWCRQYQSKSGVSSETLLTLLRWVNEITAGEPFTLAADQQGGRHNYRPLVQEAFPEQWVTSRRQADASVYELGNGSTLTFRPRADSESWSVALASMVAKYLRELFMHEFNRFWCEHVPGLRPTAGYPVDAKRFLEEIRPAMTQLGLEPAAIWRER